MQGTLVAWHDHDRVWAPGFTYRPPIVRSLEFMKRKVFDVRDEIVGG